MPILSQIRAASQNGGGWDFGVIDKCFAAASVVTGMISRSVVVKTEVVQKAKLSIYQSACGLNLACTHSLW